MNFRAILLCTAFACFTLGCSSMENAAAPQPTPAPGPVNPNPPVDESSPVTGGQLYNGNY